MSFTYAVVGAGRQGTAAAYDMARFGDATEVRIADARPRGCAACRRPGQRPAGARCLRAVRRGRGGSGRPARLPRGRRLVPLGRPVLVQPGDRPGRHRSPRVHDRPGREHRARAPAAHPVARGGGCRDRHDPGLRPGPRHGHEPHRLRHVAPRRDRRGDVLGRRQPAPPAAALQLHPDLQHRRPHERVPRRGALPAGRAADRGPDLPGGGLRDGRLPRARSGGWRRSWPAAGPRRCPGRSRGSSARCGTRRCAGPATSPRGRRTWTPGCSRPTPIDVGGVQVVPRDVLHALLDPKIRAKPGEPDLVIVRVLARGRKDGRAAEVVVELIDRFDEATGFTAMERTTGWDGSIKAILNARGVTPARRAPGGGRGARAPSTPTSSAAVASA